MNDKSLEILNKYDIEINRVYRGRGGMIIATQQGIKLFYECVKSDKYYERESHMTDMLCEYGFKNVDSYIRNNDGQIITEDEDGKKYILKNWYDAQECDVKNTDFLLSAVKSLAKLHTCFTEIAKSNNMFENADKIVPIDDGRAVNDDVEENVGTKNYGEEKDVTDNYGREQSGTGLVKPIGFVKAASAAGAEYMQVLNLRDSYEKHARELKKVQNFLKTKKKRQEFEQIAYKNLEYYYSEAKESVEMLGTKSLLKRYEKAVKDREIMHGSYNYHNVLCLENDCAITNFDKYKNECQICDLYQFMRKSLEKHNWNVDLGYRLMDSYDSIKPLQEDDIELMAGMFSFPEKFWKIINQYFNASKSWIPGKNVDKLKQAIITNSARREFVDKIRGVC